MELNDYLDGERLDGTFNRRNGTSKKSVLTGTSKIELSVPRYREGRFDLQLIAKYQRRFPDFDEKIILMYSRGLSREVRGRGCGMAKSPAGPVFPIVFFDAIWVKIRDEGFVRNKAVYIALGILPDGTKEILGIWI